MVSRLVVPAVALAVGLSGSALVAQKKKGEWVEGVAYTSDWDEAIKAVGRSGKMLFIYNGWERRGV